MWNFGRFFAHPRGSNFGLRESAFEGWIDTLMAVGETFTAGSYTYLIHALETLSDAYEFTARRCNSLIALLTLTVTEDSNGNMIQTFTDTVVDQDCYGQIVTASLRETDDPLRYVRPSCLGEPLWSGGTIHVF